MPEVISIAQPVPADEESVSPPPKKRAVPVFVHGLGIPPVPGRLVEKILDGQFVDMAELLPDNIELLRREAAVPRLSSDSKARLRLDHRLGSVLHDVRRDSRASCTSHGAGIACL